MPQPSINTDEPPSSSFSAKPVDIPKNRKYMAWTAMVSMITATCFLFSPFITNDRIAALLPVLSTFYYAMVSVVGAFVGFQFWANKK